MKKPADHIMEAADHLGIPYRVLDAGATTTMRDEITARFVSRQGRTLWERLGKLNSRQDSDGWRVISNYIRDTEFVLFFDEDEDKRMLLWSANTDLESIQADSIGFNDHDFVISSIPLDVLYGTC